MKRMPMLAIRVKILMLLKSIPMGTGELAEKVGCGTEEIKEQLAYLERENKIQRIRSEKFNQDFWRLKQLT